MVLFTVEKAILVRAIEDFNKLIALVPKDAGTYCNRGETWLHLKEWQKAKADLTTAKNMGCDIIESFQKDYESVAAFEARYGVQVPEDIAARTSAKVTLKFGIHGRLLSCASGKG